MNSSLVLQLHIRRDVRTSSFVVTMDVVTVIMLLEPQLGSSGKIMLIKSHEMKFI